MTPVLVNSCDRRGVTHLDSFRHHRDAFVPARAYMPCVECMRVRACTVVSGCTCAGVCMRARMFVRGARGVPPTSRPSTHWPCYAAARAASACGIRRRPYARGLRMLITCADCVRWCSAWFREPSLRACGSGERTLTMRAGRVGSSAAASRMHPTRSSRAASKLGRRRMQMTVTD